MALHKETDDILFAELPVRQGIRAADAFEEGHEPLERKHPLRGGLRFMRGDEQAAAFGPQTLKQREDAGVRSALWEGAAKIEVTECGHMPGDFRFVGVRADFTPMMESAIRGTGSPASRRTAAMASRTSGALSTSVPSRSKRMVEKGNAESCIKNSLQCPPEKPQASPYEGVYGKAGSFLRLCAATG